MPLENLALFACMAHVFVAVSIEPRVLKVRFGVGRQAVLLGGGCLVAGVGKGESLAACPVK